VTLALTRTSTPPLAIYLDDHLMAASAGLRLIERSRDAHRERDPDVHRLLARLADEVSEDRAVVRRALGLVGGTPNPLKQVSAVAGELLGRVKSNGRVVRRSRLTSLVELEAIAIALRGKRCGWAALHELDDPRLRPIDFAALTARADRQYDEVEAARLRVATSVLPAPSA
jgi:hypothetical protein